MNIYFIILKNKVWTEVNCKRDFGGWNVFAALRFKKCPLTNFSENMTRKDNRFQQQMKLHLSYFVQIGSEFPVQ